MAEAIFVELASGLVSKLVSLAADEVILAWNINEDLNTLRERLELVDALLSDAAKKKVPMITVQKWFNKLEAVARVADVFMDELEYEVTRQKVEKHHNMRDFFIPSKNTIIYRFKMAHKIKSILTSFHKIFKWAGDLGIHPVGQLSSSVQHVIRDTPPCEDESQIVGRDNDMSHLVEMMSKNCEENLQVIAIVGMGGQGKTTLARMVYNKDDVINMFSKRVWVTVSDDFDFTKVLNQMVESLTSTNLGLKNTEGLINELRKSLKGKKLLLVLDDVWNENPEEWETLMNSLLGIGGAKGSKILVTTRNQKVIDAMQCSVSYRLERLSEDESWKLFKKRAFSPGGVLETEVLAALGRRMVQRCGGLPLAIKALGGLLHSKKSEQEWLCVQNSEIWKSNGVLSSLRLSYDNLPYSSLKQCFAYCSIIPKDSYINKDKLVQIWMSLGFLLPPKGSNALMEDIGIEYLNILLWNCLLQDVHRDEFQNIIGFKMHDLVHDLALYLSKDYSVTMKAVHELNNISGTLHLRLNIGYPDVKPTILKRNFKRVQLLHAGAHVFRDVAPYLKHLKVLILESYNVTSELPSSLSSMKYLKYLDISSFNGQDRLPDDLMKLYNLQTLRVPKLEELPKKFCNLINLRHLYITDIFAKRSCMFTGIERLTLLQTLPYFVVSRDQNCLVGQLGRLINLSGELNLYDLDLGSIGEARKAMLYKKPNIQSLRLEWRYDADEREDGEYKDEMEGLKPHINIKELRITYFNGKKFASWIKMMTNLVKITLSMCKRCEVLLPLGHLPKLREMDISCMENLKVIESYFDKCPETDNSELSGRGAKKVVTTMYPSLTKLVLLGLPKLEELIETATSQCGEDQSTMQVFPKLELLEIGHCSNLTGIPNSCFLSLKNVVITNLESTMVLETMSRKARSLTALSLHSISNGRGDTSSTSNMDSIVDELLKNNSMSLKSLRITQGCEGLRCLTLNVAIETLEVVNCPDLVSINVVEGSGGLKVLEIGGCPALSQWVFIQSMRSTLVRLSISSMSEEFDRFPWSFCSAFPFPNLISLALFRRHEEKSTMHVGELDDRLCSTFPALTELLISGFNGVKALPDSIAKIPSLKELSISNCENLENLPMFEQSHGLQWLQISQCPNLKERCRKMSGQEWFKIQHISHIEIDRIVYT